MTKLYGSAHLVICRAGAMTVAELEATGRPAIFVPLPIAGGHQRDNTLRAVDAGAAVVVEESNYAEEALRNVLRSLLGDRAKLRTMAQAMRLLGTAGTTKPAERIAEVAMGIAITTAE